ncbi:MAG: type II toxin-antitoxin system RelE/ParE family toxin [Bacteroidaceae bacterium]|nr:type II toxin-antitoxin system RelE/ParE family toxin [Bacteroidaceae bacterium]
MAKVIWEEEARERELSILEYGRKNFGVHASKKLYEKFKRAETNLMGNPLIGMREVYLANRSHDYRSLFVPEYFKLVYYYDEMYDTVFISDVWDTRREPVVQAFRLS